MRKSNFWMYDSPAKHKGSDCTHRLCLVVPSWNFWTQFYSSKAVAPGTKLYCFGEKGHLSNGQVCSPSTNDCSQLCRLLSLHRLSDMFICLQTPMWWFQWFLHFLHSERGNSNAPPIPPVAKSTCPFCPPRHRCLYPGPPHRPGDSKSQDLPCFHKTLDEECGIDGIVEYRRLKNMCCKCETLRDHAKPCLEPRIHRRRSPRRGQRSKLQWRWRPQRDWTKLVLENPWKQCEMMWNLEKGLQMELEGSAWWLRLLWLLWLGNWKKEVRRCEANGWPS